MSDKTKFARDFPEVCDLWKSFDTRPRYNADNMMQAYCAGYAAALEAARPAPEEPPATEALSRFCPHGRRWDISGSECSRCRDDIIESVTGDTAPADQPVATETGPCDHDFGKLFCWKCGEAPRDEPGALAFERAEAEIAPQGAPPRHPDQHVYFRCDGGVRVQTDPRGAPDAEANRALAARLGATMTAGVVVTEPQGAPSEAINGHVFMLYTAIERTNCDKCGLQFGARFTRACEVV